MLPTEIENGLSLKELMILRFLLLEVVTEVVMLPVVVLEELFN